MLEQPPKYRPVKIGFWTPPFYYGWVIIFVVFIAEFIGSAASMMGFPLFVQPLREEFGWSLTTVVATATFHSMFLMASAPVLGPLLDRYGGRPLMSLGAVIVCISLVFTSRVQEIWQLWLFYGVTAGIGINMLGHLAASVVVPKWFIRRRGRAMAITTIANSSGGMVFAPIIGFLIAGVGWRDTWLVLAGVVLVVIPLSIIFMRRTPEDLGLAPDGDLPANAADGAMSRNGKSRYALEETWTLTEALHTRTLWILVLAMNLLALAAGAPVTLLVPFLVEQQGMSSEGAAFVWTAALFAATFSRAMWGLLVERFNFRFCMATMFFSRSLGPLALIVIPFPLNLIVFIVCWGGIGGSFILFQGLVWANYYGRTFAGSIQGSLRPLISISGFGGPLFIAVLTDIRGSYDLAFAIATAMGLVSVILVLMAKPPTRAGSEAVG